MPSLSTLPATVSNQVSSLLDPRDYFHLHLAVHGAHRRNIKENPDERFLTLLKQIRDPEQATRICKLKPLASLRLIDSSETPEDDLQTLGGIRSLNLILTTTQQDGGQFLADLKLSLLTVERCVSYFEYLKTKLIMLPFMLDRLAKKTGEKLIPQVCFLEVRKHLSRNRYHSHR